MDIDKTNSMPNQHAEDIAANLIQQWKMSSGRRKNKSLSTERLSITNDSLLPILTSLKTETTAESNDATE